MIELGQPRVYTRLTAGTELEKIRKADALAIAKLYDQHQQKLRNLALRLIGDPSRAEDLVHDVFVTLPKAIRNFRGDSSISTFLCGILVNMAKRHIRSAARRRKAMDRLARQPQHPSDDPEHRQHNSEIIDKIQLALDQLPIAQRTAFILCEVEQYSSIEAAGVLQISPATVRTRLFHAKKKLRAILGNKANS